MDCSDKIYINDNSISAIKQFENLEFKMYSEGRISIVIIVNSMRYTSTIDIKKGNIYYFEINPVGKYREVEAPTGKEFLTKITNTIKVEEDRNNPIFKSTNVEDGPKQGTCFFNQ